MRARGPASLRAAANKTTCMHARVRDLPHRYGLLADPGRHTHARRSEDRVEYVRTPICVSCQSSVHLAESNKLILDVVVYLQPGSTTNSKAASNSLIYQASPKQTRGVALFGKRAREGACMQQSLAGDNARGRRTTYSELRILFHCSSCWLLYRAARVKRRIASQVAFPTDRRNNRSSARNSSARCVCWRSLI